LSHDEYGRKSTLSLPLYEQLGVAVATIRGHLGTRRPTVGLVLGSGLGGFADGLPKAVAIEYRDIPHFPVSTVEGHAGRLVVGEVGGVTVAAMQGRVHYYEGLELARVTFPVRALCMLGCQTIVITNAAGGINKGYHPGDLVVIEDHLNLFPESPLRGVNDARLGPRFPDMTRAYPSELRALALRAAAEAGVELKQGVYAGLPGPAYETPAEIRMLRTLGADLCGMSTVPEVIAATHQGARCLGISCVTNMAAGITGERLSHQEVTDTATRVRATFTKVLGAVLAALGREGRRA
jgi:purine-nucleoside phosphorylase